MKTSILFLSGAVIFLASCHTPRYVYSPAPPVNPYFKEKGDSKISAYYAVGGSEGSYGGGQNHGFDIQGAYALTDNLAVTADHFSRKERDIYNFYESNDFDSSKVNYRRNTTGFGIGYFTAMNRRKKVTFNLYGGVGFGKFNIDDKGVDDTLTAYSRFYKSNITKWYLQPGFNFMPGKVFWCSFTTRFVFAKYSGVTTSYTASEQDHFDLKNLSGRTLAFFEPSYNMQIGVPRCPWLKINSGITFCANLNSAKNEDYGTYYEARGFTAFIGLNFDLSKINNK